MALSSLKEIDIEQNCRTLCMSECVCVCVCVCERNDKGKETEFLKNKWFMQLFCTDHRSFPWIFTQLKREIEYVSVLWSVRSAVCRLFWNIITVNSLKSVFTKYRSFKRINQHQHYCLIVCHSLVLLLLRHPYISCFLPIHKLYKYTLSLIFYSCVVNI